MIRAGIDADWLLNRCTWPEARVVGECVLSSRQRETAQQSELMLMAINASFDKDARKSLKTSLKEMRNE